MPVAEVNGQKINYADSGGDGQSVIFSHGFLMDQSMFDTQVEALGADYRCVVWDERGFGETPVDDSFSYWDSANDAVALLDHLGIEKAVFVGMSQGGFLSLRAALAHPARVAGIVMIDSESSAFTEEQIEGYGAMFGQWKASDSLGELGETVAGMIIGDPDISKEWIAKWEARDRSTLQAPMETLLFRDDITDRVGEIDCPVLIIHGEEDQAIPMEAAEDLMERLSDCRGLVKVPGAAHAPNMTHPQIVNDAIASFLSEI
ncbi:MAG: alpha/beta hydrolase [Acidimicrobiales bacterium]|nr:alpha/beta hydrolase [Acidimicrobiales bacterium]